MSKEDQHPTLGDTQRSKVLRVGASVLGTVPVIGPPIQTVLTELIPNVRADRIEAYIRYLQDQIDELKLKLALEKPEGLDLFEEGIWQSARAISDDRKKYIAELVAKGLQETGLEQQETRHFMRILEQLDDRQIILLAEYHPANSPTAGNVQGTSFHEVNRNVVQPGHTVEDILDHTGREEAQRGARLNEIMRRHLSSLGLLERDQMFGGVEMQPSSNRYLISEAGKDFLRCIGAISSGGDNGQ
ncbi:MULTISPECIES: hypothetical protein [unclassified Thalassospira]|uniref:hypothetical protein n=1 Tax=unclassified Thalassospira TaxID=2648997 RepID=UPI000C5C968C|nr:MULTISPECIES: hypothetical protein [unclassified Thalassospira]MBC45060.1 hypothetical protein [Thalassospira sp.]HAI29617.1 hypothetical protein [Thalassospira sp.]|tara:strand:- start:13541 stop:14272 length:732 start_codon:yes stop_codon:yes gene_type:complete